MLELRAERSKKGLGDRIAWKSEGEKRRPTKWSVQRR